MEKEVRNCVPLFYEQGYHVPKSRSQNDVWKLGSMAEAPPCEVCGWCSDDIPVSAQAIVRGIS